MFGRFLRWCTIIEVRWTLWRFGMTPTAENRRRWRNYIRTGNGLKDGV